MRMREVKRRVPHPKYTIKVYSTKNSFDLEAKRQLARDLAEVTASAFDGVDYNDTFAHVFGDRRTPDRILLVAFTENGKAVGFASFQEIKLSKKTQILHLIGTAIHRSHHRNHLATAFILGALDPKKHDYLTFRTQNPVMYHTLLRDGDNFPSVHPRIDGKGQLINPSKAAWKIMKAVYLKAGEGRLTHSVTKGVYPVPLYTITPSSRSPLINDFFAKNVGPHDGLFVAAEVGMNIRG